MPEICRRYAELPTSLNNQIECYARESPPIQLLLISEEMKAKVNIKKRSLTEKPQSIFILGWIKQVVASGCVVMKTFNNEI